MAGEDAATREPSVMRFERSALAYEQRQVAPPFGPFVWARPTAGLRALSDAMPWEALVVSGLAAAILWAEFGQDVGASLGLGISLALVTTQMLRERQYATATRLVHERGLLIRRRQVTALDAVEDVRVEGSTDLGDIVLSGEFGAMRIRAVRRPHQALGQLQDLVASARRGRTRR